MKITDVQAVILRQPVLDEGIADGSQDDLVILVHTDEGLTGIGEVDSAPEAVRALVDAPGSFGISIEAYALTLSRFGVPISSQTGLPAAFPAMSQSAMSRPLIACITIPRRPT